MCKRNYILAYILGASFDKGGSNRRSIVLRDDKNTNTSACIPEMDKLRKVCRLAFGRAESKRDEPLVVGLGSRCCVEGWAGLMSDKCNGIVCVGVGGGGCLPSQQPGKCNGESSLHQCTVLDGPLQSGERRGN